MTRQQTQARRTSQYTLTIPAPEHADADLHAALDALIGSSTALVTGCYLTRDALPRPTLSVAYRATDDDAATGLALRTLASYGAADPADANLHTGYGISRRDFPVAGA
jgi:hypothetical protein